MNNHLRIAVGVEVVAAALQLLAQLRKVIDFAVEHDPHTTIFVVNGLAAAGEVDNAEPAHAQADVSLRVDAFFIRTAMHNSLCHPANVFAASQVSLPADEARYPAHAVTSAGPGSSANSLRKSGAEAAACSPGLRIMGVSVRRYKHSRRPSSYLHT